jgi:hypothetical protein
LLACLCVVCLFFSLFFSFILFLFLFDYMVRLSYISAEFGMCKC